MKRTTLLAIAATLMVATPASGHFLYHHKQLTLEQKIAYFKRSVAHDRGSIAWFKDQRAVLHQRYLAGYESNRTYGKALYEGLMFHKAALRWHKNLLRRYQARVQPVLSLPPHYNEWLCIHSYEGSWTDSGAPYYGGLQFGYPEWQRFGAPYTGKGTADLASPLEQMWAAERYYRLSGFYPWPNTARSCGLI